jgi:hypothetical protein
MIHLIYAEAIERELRKVTKNTEFKRDDMEWRWLW